MMGDGTSEHVNKLLFCQVSVCGVIIFILFCVVSWPLGTMFFFYCIIFSFVTII